MLALVAALALVLAPPSAPEAPAPSAAPVSADPTTPGGLLEVLQAAAAAGDAEAFGPYLELFPEERETAEAYVLPGLLPGGDWHDLFLALSPADLTETDGGAYMATMLMEWEVDGDTYESSLHLVLAPLGDEYRVVSVLMAG